MPTAESANESPSAALDRLWYGRPPLSPRGCDRPRHRRTLNRPIFLSALSPDPSDLRARVVAAGDDIDWDWLVDRARAHKVPALFLTALDNVNLRDSIPERLLPLCGQLQEAAVQRARRAEETLAEVLDAMMQQSIRCMLIKGPLLSEHVYGDPLRRPFSDIDLVVHPNDLGRAEDVLVAVGYAYAPLLDESHRLSREASREFELAHRHAFTYRRRGRMTVDLHWSLASPSVLQLQPDDVWDYATGTTVSGRATECLEPAAAAVHLAVHALGKAPMCGFQLLHLCDLVWTLDRQTNEIEADRLWLVAQRWKAARFVYSAIGIAAKLFPTVIGRQLLRSAPHSGRFGVSTGANDERLVDQVRTRFKGLHLLQLVLTQARWEIAVGRSPRAAARILLNTWRRF